MLHLRNKAAARVARFGDVNKATHVGANFGERTEVLAVEVRSTGFLAGFLKEIRSDPDDSAHAMLAQPQRTLTGRRRRRSRHILAANLVRSGLGNRLTTGGQWWLLGTCIEAPKGLKIFYEW